MKSAFCDMKWRSRYVKQAKQCLRLNETAFAALTTFGLPVHVRAYCTSLMIINQSYSPATPSRATQRLSRGSKYRFCQQGTFFRAIKRYFYRGDYSYRLWPRSLYFYIKSGLTNSLPLHKLLLVSFVKYGAQMQRPNERHCIGLFDTILI